MTEMDAFLGSFDDEPGYLDWAAFGPISGDVRRELLGDVELLGTGRRGALDLVGEHVGEGRRLLAELLGVAADGVVLQPATTFGLMHAIFGVEGGLMLSRAEFPSLTVTASRAQQALGTLTPQWLEPADGFVTPDVVREALTEDTRALAVSLVDFRTGYLADLTALRDVIGDRLLIVDAMQAFGAVEADYGAADVVCGNGYKWLRAGRGTGFSWFSERAIDRVRPVLSGWAGTDVDLPVDAVPAPSASARAFAVSSPDPLATARLVAALATVQSVGIGRIAAELTERTGDVMFLADRYGIPVVTPRDPQRRAGIVTLRPAAQDVAPLAASLVNHGITVTLRSGQIRVSPHVGTGADTMRLFGDALAAVSAAGAAPTPTAPQEFTGQ